jgi:hypothetical protein
MPTASCQAQQKIRERVAAGVDREVAAEGVAAKAEGEVVKEEGEAAVEVAAASVVAAAVSSRLPFVPPVVME